MRSRFIFCFMDQIFDKRVVILDAAKAIPGDDLPGAVLSNERLSCLMAQIKNELLNGPEHRSIEISDVDFPYERVGVSSRRILNYDFDTLDLAAAAANKICSRRSDLHNIKAVITATVTPGRVCPNMSSALQHLLNLPQDVLTIDIRVGCSGYVAALETAVRILQTFSPGAMALVIGTDCMSRIVDASDRGTCIIFGDGGGAILLGRSDDSDQGTALEASASYSGPWHFVSAESYADGSKGEHICVSSEGNEDKLIYRFAAKDGMVVTEPDLRSKLTVRMDGRAVYKDMLRIVPAKIKEHLRRLNLTVDDVDLFLFHQANVRMIEAIAKSLHIPDEKIHNNIEYLGNTTDACIPCLWADTVARNNPKQRRAFTIAFGTGYAINMVYLER